MSEHTDSERLNWLESRGNRHGWVCRESTTERGYRIHNSESPDSAPTIREAIDRAMTVARSAGR